VLTRMGLLKKKSEWSIEEFRSHWLLRHGPLARRLSGLRGYVQNHIVNKGFKGVDIPRDAEEYDGFSQLWFDNDAAMHAAIATDLGRALVADESHFIGDLRIALVQEDEIVPPANRQSLVKYMSLLTRRGNITPERFCSEWKGPHASQARALPGVRGYRQNLIIERQVPKGAPVGYERLPIDGVSELWFDNEGACVAAFASSEGRQMVERARDVIVTFTTYLVEAYVIV
jgi:uncharacterized protein (TIGR02118 family)